MSNPNGFFTNNGVKLTLKIFFIGFIGILMLLATGIVQSVVSERESYKSGFIWEMSEFRGKDLIFRDEIKWKF